jgi:hypothetical protein
MTKSTKHLYPWQSDPESCAEAAKIPLWYVADRVARKQNLQLKQSALDRIENAIRLYSAARTDRMMLEADLERSHAELLFGRFMQFEQLRLESLEAEMRASGIQNIPQEWRDRFPEALP